MDSPNPLTSHMMTLNCQVSCDEEPFQVHISGNQSIAELKKAIVAETPGCFRGLEPHKLKLWKPLTTLNTENQSLPKFDSNSALKMWAIRPISYYWPDPPCDCIHIIIEVPCK